MGLYFEAKGKDDGDDDYSGRVKTPKKTPKKSKAATPKRGKGGKVENRGRPAKAETPAKKSPAKKSKSPAKKTKTPKKETPKKAPAKKEPPKVGDKNVGCFSTHYCQNSIFYSQNIGSKIAVSTK